MTPLPVNLILMKRLQFIQELSHDLAHEMEHDGAQNSDVALSMAEAIQELANAVVHDLSALRREP